MVAGATEGEAWQNYDPLLLDMYRKFGGASVMLRQFARMHELIGLYREAERSLRGTPPERSLVYQTHGARRTRLGAIRN